MEEIHDGLLEVDGERVPRMEEIHDGLLEVDDRLKVASPSERF